MRRLNGTDDRLDVGLPVDPDLLPDPRPISTGVARAFADLFQASGLGDPTPVAHPFGSEVSK